MTFQYGCDCMTVQYGFGNLGLQLHMLKHGDDGRGTKGERERTTILSQSMWGVVDWVVA